MDKKKRKPFDWFSPDDEDWFKTPFSHLFEEIEKEQEELFRELERELEKEQEELRRLPTKSGKGGYRTGIFFSISSDGKHPPKIEVSRLGPRGWEPIQEKALGRVPMEKIGTPIELPTPSYPAPRAKPVTGIKPPITYEEAPYTYSIDVDKITIELKISGAKNEENIDLRFYPESLEVKVVVPETKKGYFAVLKVPAQIDRENTKIKLETDKVTITIPRKHPIIRGVER
jgi:HSP20 family molecular chaperone IbpA